MTAAPTVALLDYGSGNLRSAERALQQAGAHVEVVTHADAIGAVAALVVPGVGAFASCVRGLEEVGGRELVLRRVADELPVLGICVGMQVLYEAGEERGSRTEGLGVLRGETAPLTAPVLPHMGWSPVAPAPGSRLFHGIERERFYFVHSCAARPTGEPGESTAEHGDRFVAAVERGSLAATQFHPEKSGGAGIALLRNWLGTL